MTDWIGFVHNPIDPDVGYELFYDYWLPVNYGWVTEPCQSTEEE